MTRTLPLMALPLMALPLMALVLAGCPDPMGTDEPIPDAYSACHTEDGHDFEIAAADSGGAPVSIAGDTLLVDVAYGGGCEAHVFVVCWDGAFAESEPVQASLELWHGGPDDLCDAYIHETLSLDLTPLKEAWHTAYGDGAGTITVHVAGAPDGVAYSFE